MFPIRGMKVYYKRPLVSPSGKKLDMAEVAKVSSENIIGNVDLY